jgi:predicted nuclease with TOPRIM domain
MKTSLAQKYVDPECPDMSPGENTELATQVAKLGANVQHVRDEVIEIKADLRDLNKRFEAKFDGVDKKFDGVDKKFERVEEKIGALGEKFSEKFDEMKDTVISARLWAFGLYVALAGTLLYVIARSAKWI